MKFFNLPHWQRWKHNNSNIYKCIEKYIYFTFTLHLYLHVHLLLVGFKLVQSSRGQFLKPCIYALTQLGCCWEFIPSRYLRMKLRAWTNIQSHRWTHALYAQSRRGAGICSWCRRTMAGLFPGWLQLWGLFSAWSKPSVNKAVLLCGPSWRKEIWFPVLQIS